MKDGLGIKGNVYMSVTDKNGNRENYHFQNRVVQSGIGLLISRFLSCTGEPVTTMALGTGTTPPDGTDTGMESLFTTAPVTNSITTLTPPIGGAIEFRSTLQIASAGFLGECGMFCGNTLFARSVFPRVPVDVDMVIDMNWVISITSI